MRESIFEKSISMSTWIAWFGATIFAVLCVAGFAYATFQTKDEAKTHDQAQDHRLERIENKVDVLIEQGK